MPTFSATYTSPSGQTRRLQLQSADLTAARRSLRQRGIVPTTLEEVSGEASSQGSEGLCAEPWLEYWSQISRKKGLQIHTQHYCSYLKIVTERFGW